MTEIISSVAPGWYSSAQSITVTFPANTRKAIITRDGRSPVLTEILAYDVGPILPIPSFNTPEEEAGNTNPKINRPFIAVTQDGRGNVTFDGGFPKFMNTNLRRSNGDMPLTWNSWADAPAAYKYLDNCIKFCANPRKTARGNRKVLVLNTAKADERYGITHSLVGMDPPSFVDPSHPTEEELAYVTKYGVYAGHFADAFRLLTQLGGWEFTLESPPLGTGKFDYGTDYLEQFGCVIFMSTAEYITTPSASERRLTEHCAKEISTYRMNGNGVIVITDHTNKNFTDINDAQTGYIFTPDANALSKYFGAYFSGDVYRFPVKVEEIRRQLSLNGGPGDHPLLDGLTNDEYVYAGPSESLVMPQLFTADEVPANQPYMTTISGAGEHRINVLVQLDDGTILTKPMRFFLIDPNDFHLRDKFGRSVGANHDDFTGAMTLTLDSTNPEFQRTLDGELWINDKIVGFFRSAPSAGKWSTEYLQFGGPKVCLDIPGDSLVEFRIKTPIEYTVSTVQSIIPQLEYAQASIHPSEWPKKIVTHPYFAGKPYSEIMGILHNHADQFLTLSATIGPTNKPMDVWAHLGKGRLPFIGYTYFPIESRIYATDADFQQNKPAFGNKGEICSIKNTAVVWYWEDLSMKWVKHPLTAPNLFLPTWYMVEYGTGKYYKFVGNTLVEI